MDRGGVCASITDIDHMPARGGSQMQHASILADPVVEGAIPAKLWGEGGWTVGPLAGAPVRQSDQVMKVAVAPWVDQAGDYHSGSEVYAVMRRADWYAPRPSLTQRIELSVRRPIMAPARVSAPATTAPRSAIADAHVAVAEPVPVQPQLMGAPVPVASFVAH